MFSIFEVDCTLYHDSTSVDCEGFTVYIIPHCDPYCWKTIWLVCSIITSTVWFCLLHTKMLPRLRPARNEKIFWSIIKKPYFWSLNTTAVFYQDPSHQLKCHSYHFHKGPVDQGYCQYTINECTLKLANFTTLIRNSIPDTVLVKFTWTAALPLYSVSDERSLSVPIETMWSSKHSDHPGR